jgi:hypothetical protein
MARSTITSLFVVLALVLGLVSAGTRPDDLKWLEAKRAEPGVVSLPSGLLYKGTNDPCIKTKRASSRALIHVLTM